MWNGQYKIRNVHRVMYVLYVADVQDGVSVMHLEPGHNKLCCEPSHLRADVQAIDLSETVLRETCHE
jgi:hypothetical protein